MLANSSFWFRFGRIRTRLLIDNARCQPLSASTNLLQPVKLAYYEPGISLLTKIYLQLSRLTLPKFFGLAQRAAVTITTRVFTDRRPHGKVFGLSVALGPRTTAALGTADVNLYSVESSSHFTPSAILHRPPLLTRVAKRRSTRRVTHHC